MKILLVSILVAWPACPLLSVAQTPHRAAASRIDHSFGRIERIVPGYSIVIVFRRRTSVLSSERSVAAMAISKKHCVHSAQDKRSHRFMGKHARVHLRQISSTRKHRRYLIWTLSRNLDLKGPGKTWL